MIRHLKLLEMLLELLQQLLVVILLERESEREREREQESERERVILNFSFLMFSVFLLLVFHLRVLRKRRHYEEIVIAKPNKMQA